MREEQVARRARWEATRASTLNRPEAACERWATRLSSSDRDTAGSDNLDLAAPSTSCPVGRHVGIGGGYIKALDYARRVGCAAVQVFPGNPTGWRHAPLQDGLAPRVRAAACQAGLAPVVIHAPYIINLASPDEALRARSRAGLANCLSRADEIGATAVVLHVGSHRGTGVEAGIERLTDSVREILDGYQGAARVLLENSVGAGNTLGGPFEELSRMLTLLPVHRVGLCLDTAHVWGAGHDISTASGGQAMVASLAASGCLDRLGLLHLNDSAVGLGSRRDVHALLGEGAIGLAGLGGVLTALGDAGARAPIILETADDGPARETLWQRLVGYLLDGDLEAAEACHGAAMALPVEQGSFPEG